MDAMRIFALISEERLRDGTKLERVLIDGKSKTVITVDGLLHNLRLIAESDEDSSERMSKKNK